MIVCKNGDEATAGAAFTGGNVLEKPQYLLYGDYPVQHIGNVEEDSWSFLSTTITSQGPGQHPDQRPLAGLGLTDERSSLLCLANILLRTSSPAHLRLVQREEIRQGWVSGREEVCDHLLADLVTQQGHHHLVLGWSEGETVPVYTPAGEPTVGTCEDQVRSEFLEALTCFVFKRMRKLLGTGWKTRSIDVGISSFKMIIIMQ